MTGKVRSFRSLETYHAGGGEQTPALLAVDRHVVIVVLDEEVWYVAGKPQHTTSSRALPKTKDCVHERHILT